jgi:hypothetical protein
MVWPSGSSLIAVLTRPRALAGIGFVASTAALCHLVARWWLGEGSTVVLAPNGRAAYAASLYVTFPIGSAVFALIVRDALGRLSTPIQASCAGATGDSARALG